MLRSLEVRTNDPNRRRVYFSLAAETPVGLTVYPSSLQLVADNSPGGQVGHASLSITTPPDTLLDGVRAEQVGVESLIEKQWETQQARGWTLRVTPADDLTPGRHEGQLVLEMTSGGQPAPVRVPVVLTVRANALCKPPRLFFGFATLGEELDPRNLTLCTRSGEACRILGVQTSDPRITATVVAEGVVAVSVATDHVGVLAGDLVLRTDIPREETLHVPVHVHVVGR